MAGTRPDVALILRALANDAFLWGLYVIAILLSAGAFLGAVYWSMDGASARQGMRLRRFAEVNSAQPVGTQLQADDVRMRLDWLAGEDGFFGSAKQLEGRFVVSALEAEQRITPEHVSRWPQAATTQQIVAPIEVSSAIASAISPGMRLALVSESKQWPSDADRDAGHAFDVVSVVPGAAGSSNRSAILLVRVPACLADEIAVILAASVKPVVLPSSPKES